MGTCRNSPSLGIQEPGIGGEIRPWRVRHRSPPLVQTARRPINRLNQRFNDIILYGIPRVSSPASSCIGLPESAPQVRRFLRMRQCLRCRTARRSVPTWEVFGAGTQVSPQTGQGPASSGGRAISPKAPMSAVTDRSEIGPYLGGLRATLGPATQPEPTVQLGGTG